MNYIKSTSDIVLINIYSSNRYLKEFSPSPGIPSDGRKSILQLAKNTGRLPDAGSAGKGSDGPEFVRHPPERRPAVPKTSGKAPDIPPTTPNLPSIPRGSRESSALVNFLYKRHIL